MAVTTVTTKMVAGVKYTVQTDSNIDWSGVSNTTYFYDLTDEVVYYKDGNGVVSTPYTTITGGTYSSGTLTLDKNDGNSVSVSGFTSGNATVENYYYQISNSVDTRPIFQDSFVTINWDETGNDLEFQMDVAPGGSGDMRSLAYLVGGATQNTFITTTATPYDVYAAGVAAGNRLECFITAENDDTYPAYHITVYNTGESFLNSVWIKKIIKN